MAGIWVTQVQPCNTCNSSVKTNYHRNRNSYGLGTVLLNDFRKTKTNAIHVDLRLYSYITCVRKLKFCVGAFTIDDKRSETCTIQKCIKDTLILILIFKPKHIQSKNLV